MRSTLFLASLIMAMMGPATTLRAQDNNDTTALKPVTIHAYFREQPLLGLTASGHTIDAQQIQSQQTTTLLPAINTIAGLRMEERSPGSYRLAMRGSLIRSPFGIRNTKIYVGEFPLTDAGGNTYLNLIDPAAIASVSVLKGPDGSLYGANSGGVIRMQPKGFDVSENTRELLLSGGSYGLFQQQLSLQQKINDAYSFSLDQSFTRSDGYRENTALNKKTFQTAHQWHYNATNSLQLFLLYTDLGYRTPGGLTEAQMQENPRQARPAGGPNPGAKEQQAGIYNKTFYGGLAHHAKISKKLAHSVSVFGSNTDFENPFITNYEIRSEKNLGLRTFFSFVEEDNEAFMWQMQLGFEGQKGWNTINNFDNDAGQATDVQYKDDLTNLQSSFFYRASATFFRKLHVEASLGLNNAQIDFTRLYPVTDLNSGNIDFGNIWMPRVAASYTLHERMTVRASISKGYSAPTLAEVRSSDNSINLDLDAETGTNYEVGFRMEASNRRFVADFAAYSYQMNNGIVRQLRDNGAEYYVNAGEMDQKGLEATLLAYLIEPSSSSFIKSLTYQGAVARNFYTFGDYVNGDDDFSGNEMTAVPDWTLANTVQVRLPRGIFVNLFHHYVSRMPLNDANTVYAEKYHLVQAKAGMDIPLGSSTVVQFFIGADNVLNERYSLGNDINAFGNRFFNPAPPRNYYAGIKLGL
ncbi:TonB-dependent receptor [Sphingobacterium paludis]|uniref:Iron complex outermembrane receptor protein n=1 Tax=Sphingobacterium paludis TaxID=1476465 RepID=A0A4R7D6M4_9SPHI|nr:TonB-dependent receptor [Sphingobacterium paludis]TDS16237.1 iron complex outermembrane receptor protein [Sphingobacterium paludis]